MKNRTVQYVVLIGGVLLLAGAAFALLWNEVLPARGGSGYALGAFWIWSGFLLMMDWHPQYGEWDRWEKQVYGLAFIWMGGALISIGFLARANIWQLLFLAFVPPALIALIGRGWYVNKKRSQAWKKQNQTEKD